MGSAVDKPAGLLLVLGVLCSASCQAGGLHVPFQPPEGSSGCAGRVIPSLRKEAGLPAAGSTGSALLGGGSQSLCPWLQPAFGPASVDQMCTRRRGAVTAMHGLHPCWAATCWD